MTGRVFLRALSERRRFLVGWSIGLVALAAYGVAFYPTVRDSAQDLNRLLEEMPPALRALFTGEVVDFTSPEGYLASQYFSFMVPLLLLVMAIGWGASALAGEERRGTLDLLLSTPLPRMRLVAEKLAALAVGLAGAAVVFWAALTGVGAAVGMGANPAKTAAATVGAVLLALFFGTLALTIGAATGARGTAIGVAATVGIAGYITNSLAPLVEALDAVRPISPFYYYTVPDPLLEGLDPGHVVALVGATLGLAMLALALFERRDLGV